jgi:hypothetical protein
MSDPVHVRNILPTILAEIGQRMDRREARHVRRDHRARTPETISDFQQAEARSRSGREMSRPSLFSKITLFERK